MNTLKLKPTYQVVAGFIKREGKFLLVRRPPGKKNEGLWEFPGGKVEEDESLEEALKRELKEELGIEALKSTFLEKVLHDYGDFQIELFLFEIEFFKDEINLKEASELKWVDLDSALSLNLCEADKKLVEKILSLRIS